MTQRIVNKKIESPKKDILFDKEELKLNSSSDSQSVSDNDEEEQNDKVEEEK